MHIKHRLFVKNQGELYFVMSYTNIESDSHLSDFNDGAETLLTTIGPVKACEGTIASPSESHDFEACAGGQAHGQGAPVHPCGCYRRTALTSIEIAEAIADASAECQRLKQVQ